MRWLVCTALAYPASEPMLPVYRQALAGKRAWADRHGYTLWSPTPRLLSRLTSGRAASWVKIRLLQLGLRRGYDGVFWTDADAAITNPAVRLENWLPSACDLAFGSDWAGLNAGHILVANTLLAAAFLQAVWDWPDQQWHTRHPWEQEPIKALHATQPALARVRVLPERVMNAPPAVHQPGDFLVHAAGWRRNQLARFV